MKSVKKPSHLKGKCWEQLTKHQQDISNNTLSSLFRQEPERTKEFSKQVGDLYVDFSKNFINKETITLLFDLAKDSKLENAIRDLFNGELINHTEKRAALHMALRSSQDETFLSEGQNVSDLISHELNRIQTFVENIQAGKIKGHSERPIDTIVNIGIGGSDLGPKLVTEALSNFAVSDIKIHFVSSPDRRELNMALNDANPGTTLFIISSKSFSTSETLINAQSAIRWLEKNGCNDLQKHLVAVTTNIDAAKEFGIEENHIFQLWDWVGGRYSVWSAIGLPIAIKIGMSNFRQFLNGAALVDQHFRETPFEENIPVILALIDIWYINFFQTRSLTVFPYHHSLALLPQYIGQLIMESNGKSTDKEGNNIEYQTAPVIWGSVGPNAQHAFSQALHQGTQLIPVDFILNVKGDLDDEHHQSLVSNCIAQSEALMKGNIDVTDDPHKRIPGNHPSTTILLDGITPSSLGSLLSLYEHRCFVQSHIWNINPFDQWGVELGKTLSRHITQEMKDHKSETTHDTSTTELINRYLKANQEN